MKIEIEISDEMIRAEIGKAVKDNVRAVLGKWTISEEVLRMVNDRWPAVIGSVIDEHVANHAEIRKQVADEMARKLRLQVAAAMKAAQG